MGAVIRRTTDRRASRRAVALLVTMGLVAAACGGDGDSGTDTTIAPQTTTTVATDEPTDTTPETSDVETTEPDAPDTTESETEDTTAPDEPATSDDPREIFPSLGPPTGETIVLGLVNTEGTPGLDFPDIRQAIAGAVDYLNEHGGIGNRPIQLETCTAAGSPETSQACAQELTGKGVELVLVGLDLFIDYATYTAAGVPVVGVLPILPGDYTANARFLTGGNSTVMAATAAVAAQHFGATTVGVVSADNAGANASLAALTASLELLGVQTTSVKGGDNETDAGFQGLVRQISSGSPDVLVSLYDGAGCIGMMRARASLGIDIPVLTTGACSATEVLDQVGDDATGWSFVGVATPQDTPASAILRDIMSPVLGVSPDDVDPSALGLGGLGLFLIMTMAVHGNQLAADGVEVTGSNMFDGLDTAEDLRLWPGDSPIDCGAAPAYPSICSFIFPVAEYVGSGEVRTIPGLDAVSSLEYLP